MATPSKFSIAIKALLQLGPEQVGLYGLYRIRLATGAYRRTYRKNPAPGAGELCSLFPCPTAEQLAAVLGGEGQAALLAEADEIAAGRVRLFGGEAVDLQLALPGPLAPWSDYESGRASLRPFTEDPRLLWEGARFGWAFTLGRAYRLGEDEKYSQAFWHFFEIFDRANPLGLGPHWMSSQEVALRLMAFAWAAQVFQDSPTSTPERRTRLCTSVAEHAGRIPPTLLYARSQHNNHLLAEATGLLTAGLVLPHSRDSASWCKMGWRWLNEGLCSQIDPYGEYAQHSTNYTRVMLQLALWSNALIKAPGVSLRWPPRTREALGRSVHWLLGLLDADSGRVPNLGANDGAYLFPLSNCPFASFRPVANAAARAFLNYDLPHGAWDEMALWLGAMETGPGTLVLPRYPGDQLYGRHSWAYLRTAHFNSRPSHADQLHFDLWWNGLNIAQDAGSYRYTAPQPWDNALCAAAIHNTVTLDGRDQFLRAGRFLFLDWFNAYRSNPARLQTGALQSMTGTYLTHGRPALRHTRTVTVYADERWEILDDLSLRDLLSIPFPPQPADHIFRLHWLLPDWNWDIQEEAHVGCTLRLQSPDGMITVRVAADSSRLQVSLVRASERLHGQAVPTAVEGWCSPTYGLKVPALSLSMTVTDPETAHFKTEILLPQDVAAQHLPSAAGSSLRFW
jgi:hypothetical protein